jgi:DNA primase
MLIPDDILSDIRDRVSIVDVVGAHVTLKKAGRSFKGLCPFHSEKTPSFTVNEERGTFKCFGCDKGGNAFTFLMEAEGLDFRQAVEKLALKAGVELPRGEESEEIKKARSEREKIFDLLALATRYYRHQFTTGRAGEIARSYAAKRGIDEAAAERFNIGCAPEGWDNLSRFLDAKGYSGELLEKAGLAVKGKRGYYDRFRDRLIFPILDTMGRTISFGGREMGEPREGNPKYLNGPETPVFHKGRVLYGLFEGADAIRRSKRAIIVEGYMDVVILNQRGYPGCLATLGTALTREHVEALRRRADSAVLIFDGDEAGQKAMERSLEIFLQEGYSCSAVSLPPGEDPDSFVSEGGDLASLIEAARPLFDLCVERIIRVEGTDPIYGKQNAADAILEKLVPLTDQILKDRLLKRAADALDLDEAQLRARASGVFAKRRPARAGARGATQGDGQPAGEPSGMLEAKELDPQQLKLLSFLIHEPERRREFIHERGERWLDEGGAREAAQFVVSRTEPGENFPLEQAPERLRVLLTGLVMEPIVDENSDYSLLTRQLERRRLEKTRDDLSRRIARAVEAGDDDEFRRLGREKIRIDKEIESV